MADVINKAMRLFSDGLVYLAMPGRIPTVYFDGTPNVGDLLNEYLVPRISGREICRVRGAALPHLRAIGSLVGSASGQSRIWGSGSIDGGRLRHTPKRKNIFALRGPLTKKVVERAIGADLGPIPLGDPALLTPMFYTPQIEKQVRIGIIPHFSDEDVIVRYLMDVPSSDAKLISVRQSPEAFIDELLQCEATYSSSLHGLILSDAYSIPNRRIKVSERLVGGDFKFEDYYSTADRQEKAIRIENRGELLEVISSPSLHCRVSNYGGSLLELLHAFPPHYLRA